MGTKETAQLTIFSKVFSLLCACRASLALPCPNRAMYSCGTDHHVTFNPYHTSGHLSPFVFKTCRPYVATCFLPLLT